MGIFVYCDESNFFSVAIVAVVTKIEVPVKLLCVWTVPPPRGRYPFAVMELGDILALIIYVVMVQQFVVE